MCVGIHEYLQEQSKGIWRIDYDPPCLARYSSLCSLGVICACRRGGTSIEPQRPAASCAAISRCRCGVGRPSGVYTSRARGGGVGSSRVHTAIATLLNGPPHCSTHHGADDDEDGDDHGDDASTAAPKRCSRLWCCGRTKLFPRASLCDGWQQRYGRRRWLGCLRRWAAHGGCASRWVFEEVNIVPFLHGTKRTTSVSPSWCKAVFAAHLQLCTSCPGCLVEQVLVVGGHLASSR